MSVTLRAVWFRWQVKTRPTPLLRYLSPVKQTTPTAQKSRRNNTDNAKPQTLSYHLHTKTRTSWLRGVGSGTWWCVFVGWAAWFGIQGGFGGVGEVAVEAKVVVGGATTKAVEHCADKGGFHGVEEVHVLLLRPNRRRFALRHLNRRFHFADRRWWV